MARWLFVPYHLREPQEKKPPKAIPPGAYCKLVDALQGWRDAKGEAFGTKKIMVPWQKMEEEAEGIRKKSATPEAMAAVMSRLNTSVVKIALLDHIAIGGAWGSEIKEESFLRAAAFGRYVRDSLGGLLELIPRTPEDRRSSTLLGKLKSWQDAGNKGATKRDICRMVGGLTSDVEKILASLMYSGRIVGEAAGRKYIYWIPEASGDHEERSGLDRADD